MAGCVLLRIAKQRRQHWLQLFLPSCSLVYTAVLSEIGKKSRHAELLSGGHFERLLDRRREGRALLMASKQRAMPSLSSALSGSRARPASYVSSAASYSFMKNCRWPLRLRAEGTDLGS